MKISYEKNIYLSDSKEILLSYLLSCKLNKKIFKVWTHNNIINHWRGEIFAGLWR